jgi:hypothetical protein
VREVQTRYLPRGGGSPYDWGRTVKAFVAVGMPAKWVAMPVRYKYTTVNIFTDCSSESLIVSSLLGGNSNNNSQVWETCLPF